MTHRGRSRKALGLSDEDRKCTHSGKAINVEQRIRGLNTFFLPDGLCKETRTLVYSSFIKIVFTYLKEEMENSTISSQHNIEFLIINI